MAKPQTSLNIVPPTDRVQTEMTDAEADAIRAAEREAAAMRAQEKPLDELGRELPDSTPLEPPLNYQKTPSLSDQIRDLIRSEKLKQAAEEAGYESFDDADDFEIEDDPYPYSPYEDEFSTPLQELHRRRRQAAQDELAESDPTPSSGAKSKKSAAATSGGSVTEAAKPPKSAAAPAADANAE